MGVLTEYVRKEVDQIRAEMARRQELLDEWLTAISKLYDLLDGWIRDADNGHSILTSDRNKMVERISEPRLGRYDAPAMRVTFGGAIGSREALIVPKARFVVAVVRPSGSEPRRADGMVQINRWSESRSSVAEYYLFRWKTDAGDRWFIRSTTGWNANPDDNFVEALDRDRFEAALLQVLQ